MNRLLLCSLFLAAGTFCRAGVVLSISPSSQTVPLGSAVSFDINIAGLGSGTALGTYDITFTFDPALLSYSGTTFGNQVDILGLGDIQSVTPGTGTIEIYELSLDSVSDLNSLQSSSFLLATLTFNNLAAGTGSPITLAINALGDASGNSISADLQNGSVTIGGESSVPEPDTVVELCTGLLAIFLIRRAHHCRRCA